LTKESSGAHFSKIHTEWSANQYPLESSWSIHQSLSHQFIRMLQKWIRASSWTGYNKEKYSYKNINLSNHW